MLQRKIPHTLRTVLVLGLVSTPVLPALLLTTDSVKSQTATEAPAFVVPESLPDNAKIQIDEASSMAAASKALQERFVKKFPTAKVTIEDRTTEESLAALEKGEIDLAAIGRPLMPEEKDRGLSQVPISREKIAIVVGADNPFSGNITFEQFAKIFRGEIKDWSELGGTPGPIRFIDRPETSDTRHSFQRYPVFQKAPFQTGETAEPIAEDNTDTMVKALGKDGIGYAIASQVLNRDGIRVLSMHKTLPTDSRYPFSQPRGYVYKGTPNPAVASFLGYATTPEGQEAIKTAEAGAGGASTVAANGTGTGAGDGNGNGTGGIAPTSSANGTVAVGGAASPALSGEGGLDWWPWLLALPLVGGLLWWALKGGKDKSATPIAPVAGKGATGSAGVVTPPEGGVLPFKGAAGAVAGGAAKAGTGAVALGAGAAALGAGALGAAALGARGLAHKSRIILTPRDHENAYAYWEVSDAHKQELRQQGGKKMGVRLYDVTDIEDPNTQPAHSMQQFDVSEVDPDRHLPIPRDNRDYRAEVGYNTAEGRWLPLAQSEAVRVPARPLLDNVTKGVGAAVAGGTVLAGGAALADVAALSGLGAAAKTVVTSDRSQSRMVLTPRDASNAYVYWEATDADKAQARNQGGKKLALRVYDVSSLSAQGFQQYDIDEQSNDKHVLIPTADHDYRAELGYVADDGRWIKVTQSASVRVPSKPYTPPTSSQGQEATMLRTGRDAADKASSGLGSVTTGVGDAIAGAGDAVTGIGSKAADLGTVGLGMAAGLGAAGLGMAAGLGATVTGLGQKIGVSANPEEPTTIDTIDQPDECSIANLIVHSQRNCYVLDAATMGQIQDKAVSKTLEPGNYLIKIQSGAFGYHSGPNSVSEPLVLLWIYGGKVTNQKTKVEVDSTWSSLNGYDDLLTLNVRETATVSAFFFDTEVEDNQGEVHLSIVRM
jgi:phosphate transport system substrate-binding protein